MDARDGQQKGRSSKDVRSASWQGKVIMWVNKSKLGNNLNIIGNHIIRQTVNKIQLTDKNLVIFNFRNIKRLISKTQKKSLTSILR